MDSTHTHMWMAQVSGHCESALCAVLINRVMLCIKEIEMWMSSNNLKLNTDKTQFIWHGAKQQLAKVCCQTIIQGGTIIPMLMEVTCLSVVLDVVLITHKETVRTM